MSLFTNKGGPQRGAVVAVAAGDRTWRPTGVSLGQYRSRGTEHFGGQYRIGRLPRRTICVLATPVSVTPASAPAVPELFPWAIWVAGFRFVPAEDWRPRAHNRPAPWRRAAALRDPSHGLSVRCVRTWLRLVLTHCRTPGLSLHSCYRPKTSEAGPSATRSCAAWARAEPPATAAFPVAIPATTSRREEPEIDSEIMAHLHEERGSMDCVRTRLATFPSRPRGFACARAAGFDRRG